MASAQREVHRATQRRRTDMLGPVGAKSTGDKQDGHVTESVRSGTRLRGTRGVQADTLVLQRLVGNVAVGQLFEQSSQSSVPLTSHSVGRPLNAHTKGTLEAKFGTTFNDVLLHTDPPAGNLVRRFGADAFTFGKHIFIGQHALGASESDPLLLHELAHTLQTNDAGSFGSEPLKVTQPGDRVEMEADRVVSEVLAGERPTLSSLTVANRPAVMRGSSEEELRKKFGSSPAHPIAGGGAPPVPEVGKTPFHFISEGPALPNWKKAATEVLEREFDRKFSSFEEAHAYFKEHLKTLPIEEREDFADRMRDRVRKNFYRQENRDPSFNYSPHEMKSLKGGGAPRETLQLEHLTEVKSDPRKGIVGHPEMALDPSNVWFTEGGPRGTAPKGTPHGEKGRKLLQQTEGEKAVEEIPPAKVPSKPTTEVVPGVHKAGNQGEAASTAFAREEVAVAKGIAGEEGLAAKGLGREEVAAAKGLGMEERAAAKLIGAEEKSLQEKPLQGMGLRGGPSPVTGAIVNIGAGIAAGLLTSWLHDQIKESVEKMPRPEMKSVSLWGRQGMRGHSALDLLTSHLPNAVDELYLARGRYFFDVAAFWNDIGKTPIPARAAPLGNFEDAVWQDLGLLVQAERNVKEALEFEPQIREQVEAARDLQSYIQNPLVYYYMAIYVGFTVEEIELIKSNLAQFQASYTRGVLEPLHKLQAELEQSINGDQALLEQIKRFSGYRGRLERFLSSLPRTEPTTVK